MLKLIYKPWGALAGIAGGVLAGALFKRVWKLLSGKDDTPTATDRERGWTEIVLAAALQGRYTGRSKPRSTGAARPGSRRPPEPGRPDRRHHAPRAYTKSISSRHAATCVAVPLT